MTISKHLQKDSLSRLWLEGTQAQSCIGIRMADIDIYSTFYYLLHLHAKLYIKIAKGNPALVTETDSDA